MTSEANRLKSANKILMVAIVIAAFFLGSLTNKVATLEKNGAINPPPQVAAPKAPSDAGTAQPATGKIKPVNSSDHIRGNVNAKLSLVVYSDFECPFCQKFHPIATVLLKTYGDKIRLIYRHYPLPFHQNAQKEAEASECIAELGGNDVFWKYTDTIFERTTANGTGFALDKLGPLAKEVGVDQTKFQKCLDSGKYTQKVQDQMAKGSEEGVTGTPGTIILTENGSTQLIPGALP